MPLPALEFSSAERERGEPDITSLLLGKKVFCSKGTLVIPNLLSKEFVNTMLNAFVQKYARFFEDIKHPDALNVGNRRHMVTVELEPPFNAPEVIANPLLVALCRWLLAENCVLHSFGVVIALPGSEAQHMHRDFAPLFNPEADTTIPPYAVTVLIPLIDLTEATGSTEVIEGSHVLTNEQANGLSGNVSYMSAGSCLLMDYRVIHSGTPNMSNQARPVIYMVYSYPWFRDPRNFKKQSPLLIRRSAYEQMSDSERALLADCEFVD